MSGSNLNGKVEFSGLYAVAGEGPVVALRGANGTMLFDKQGLQHRILEKRKIGQNTEGEEQALARLNQITNASLPDLF